MKLILIDSIKMKIFYRKMISLIFLHLWVFSLGATAAWAYSKSSFKWGGTSANYYINSTFAASFRTAMQAADASWDAAGSKFKFNYIGTTGRNPNTWAYSLNGYSDIGYFNKGNNGTLAMTAGGVTGAGSTTISERDITLNTYYGFTTVGEAGKHDVQNIITHEFGHWLKLLDLSSGLSPSWCSFSWESTMCGAVFSPGETNKRSLEGDDKAGIKAIYGT